MGRLEGRRRKMGEDVLDSDDDSKGIDLNRPRPNARDFSRKDIWDAHMRAKSELLDCVNRQCAVAMDGDASLLGLRGA